MKKYVLISAKLTLAFILLCSVIYPLLIAGVSRMAPGGGRGETVSVNGKVVGYANIGQKFDRDNYFWGRPSAVSYNAAGSGGSNKGPANPDYLKDVQAKIDTFLAHNPGIRKEEVPAELATNSGSGLDPDLSPAGVKIQVKRVAAARHLDEQKLNELIEGQITHPLLGLFGPSKVNILKLNIALDELK